jgi:integral membrane sensor domain MASE1
MLKPLKRATFFLGWLLSPLTSWNDVFVNIPLSYLTARLFVKVFRTDFVVTLLAAYWFTNALGIAMMLASGQSIIRDKNNRQRELLTILGTVAIYSLIVVLIGRIIRRGI